MNDDKEPQINFAHKSIRLLRAFCRPELRHHWQILQDRKGLVLFNKRATEADRHDCEKIIYDYVD